MPNKSQSFIFSAARTWVSHYYGSTTSFTETQDQSQLVGWCSFSVYPVKGLPGDGNDHNYQYKIEIDCRDNKYRIQLYNITYSIGPETRRSETFPLEDYNAIIKKDKSKPLHQVAYKIDSGFRSTIQALADAITKAANDDF